MALMDDLLNGDVCDVPVEATLNDGSKVVFWCDGARGGEDPELTGRACGADAHLPASTVRSVRVLQDSEWRRLSQGRPVWWYRR